MSAHDVFQHTLPYGVTDLAFFIHVSFPALTLLQVHFATLDPAPCSLPVEYSAVDLCWSDLRALCRRWPSCQSAFNSRSARCPVVGQSLYGVRLQARALSALMLLFYVNEIGLRGPTTQVAVFEAARPPQIGSSIVPLQYT